MYKLVLIFSFLLLHQSLAAQTLQWTPYGSQQDGATSFVWNSSKTKLYKGTYYSGVFMSLDSGLTWSDIYTTSNGGVHSLAMKNDTLFAEFLYCGNSGIKYTANDGVTWTRIDNSIYSIQYPYEVATNSTSVFVAGYNNLHTTHNNGQIWQLFPAPSGNYFFNVAVNGPLIAGSGHNFVMVSTDNGANWNTTTVSAGWGLCIEGINLFISGPQGVRVSSDFGATWTYLGMSGENLVTVRFFGPYGFVSSANNTTNTSSVYFTNDDGQTWTTSMNGLPVNPEMLDFTMIGNRVIAGGWGSGMWTTLLTTTGEEESGHELDEFEMHPNPASGSVMVNLSQFNNENEITLELYDTKGAKVLHKHVNVPAVFEQVDLSQLKKGAYLVRVSDNRSTAIRKLMIY